jgi:hypothetical protein
MRFRALELLDQAHCLLLGGIRDNLAGSACIAESFLL